MPSVSGWYPRQTLHPLRCSIQQGRTLVRAENAHISLQKVSNFVISGWFFVTNYGTLTHSATMSLAGGKRGPGRYGLRRFREVTRTARPRSAGIRDKKG